MLEGESRDTLLDGRVVLNQPRAGFRAAIDPVFLAAAVPAKAGDRVLDLGAGTGAAALCLAARLPGCRVTGLDFQAELVGLLTRNAAASGFAARVEAIQGDVTDPPAEITQGMFDHVMTNPPYFEAARHTPAPGRGKALARTEGAAGLGCWIGAGLDRLRARGSLTLVHRAERLDAVLAALVGRAGAVTVFPLWPKAGRAAKLVVVRARMGLASPMRLAAGLVLHEPGGAYTAAAKSVLRGGHALDLQPTGIK